MPEDEDPITDVRIIRMKNMGPQGDRGWRVQNHAFEGLGRCCSRTGRGLRPSGSPRKLDGRWSKRPGSPSRGHSNIPAPRLTCVFRDRYGRGSEAHLPASRHQVS